MSLPLLLRTLTIRLNVFSKKAANLSVVSLSAFSNSPSSIGLYSIILILQGTTLQNSASSFASYKLSLKSLKIMYSNVTLVPVLS